MAVRARVGEHRSVSHRRSPGPESGVDRAVLFRRRRIVAAAGAVILVLVVVAATLLGTGVIDGGSSASSGSKPGSGKGSGVVPPVATPRSTTTTTAPPPQTPYGIQSETITLDDPTRDTPARGDVAAVSGRVLSTIILRPEGLKGPLPLIVFAHGWDSDPSKYTTLLDAWVSAGYVVAAPIFPDSADTLPGTPVSDFPDEARDLSFVITQLLAGKGSPFITVDPHRIAAAGHSDGGTDVAMLALNPAYADPRIKAYLSLSSQIPDGVDGPWGTPVAGSLLVAVGTDDEYGLLPDSTQVYQTADMVKALLTVTGGDHLDTFEADTPQSAAVREETVRFLHAALSSSPAPVAPTTLNHALQPTLDPSIVVEVGSG
jgi:dienelactone hydrolase